MTAFTALEVRLREIRELRKVRSELNAFIQEFEAPIAEPWREWIRKETELEICNKCVPMIGSIHGGFLHTEIQCGDYTRCWNDGDVVEIPLLWLNSNVKLEEK